MIRDLNPGDAETVLDIYRAGIETGEATFETSVPDWPGWDSRFHPFCRLIYEDAGEVCGWAALAPVSARHCYRGVAEVSIYVGGAYRGRGIGGALMAALVECSEARGIWTLYSSIFPENRATLKMHLHHGFREVGIRERIAQQQGRWRDTLILERRSGVTGL